MMITVPAILWKVGLVVLMISLPLVVGSSGAASYAYEKYIEENFDEVYKAMSCEEASRLYREKGILVD